MAFQREGTTSSEDLLQQRAYVFCMHVTYQLGKNLGYIWLAHAQDGHRPTTTLRIFRHLLMYTPLLERSPFQGAGTHLSLRAISHGPVARDIRNMARP